MALIDCPECNSKLSEHADLCLRCGLPRQRFAMVEAEKSRRNRPRVNDESFLGQSLAESTAAALCQKCGTSEVNAPSAIRRYRGMKLFGKTIRRARESPKRNWKNGNLHKPTKLSNDRLARHPIGYYLFCLKYNLMPRTTRC